MAISICSNHPPPRPTRRRSRATSRSIVVIAKTTTSRSNAMIVTSPRKLLGVLLGSFLVALPVGTEAQEPKNESRVVVGIFGGLLGQRLRATVESYTKANGVEAVFVEGTGNDLLAKA